MPHARRVCGRAAEGRSDRKLALALPSCDALDDRIGRMNESVERVRDALAELIKAALISDDERSLACRNAARAKLTALADAPPDPASLRLDGAWMLAIQAAEAPEFVPYEGQVNLTLPRACPFTLAEIVSRDLDADRAVERIRNSASTG